jgi:predicted ATPase/serine/threonine protein kinase
MGAATSGPGDSRPTIDMSEIGNPSAQLQMEQMFVRVQRKLFGAASRQTIAHYEVVRPIGQGAMGMVYEAIDRRLSREVALKLVLPELLPSARGKARLLREARAMAKISHPNVVAVYDVGETGDVVFIAMEFVRGVTLRRWLAGAPRSVAEILDMFVQAGAGLAAAHRAEIVHRDFKPDNVLVGEDGRARVVDFGLAFPWVARLADASHDMTPPCGTPIQPFDAMSSDVVTADPGLGPDSGDHVLAGTIAYMSPEQLRAQPLDGRSDQFSFCVALYEAVFGQRPFTGRTFHEFSERVQRGELAPVTAPPRLPAWIAAVLRRGLAVDPARRYASMPELLSVLTAGRHAIAASRTRSPTWSGTRDRLLGKLGCTHDEQLTASPHTALVRVQPASEGAPWLVVVPHDPRRPELRAAFVEFAARLRDAPPELRPSRLVDDDGCLALVFEDRECVTLGGLIRQPASRDHALALKLATALTQLVYALAQLGYALDPAALDAVPVAVDSYALGPIDPTWVVDAGEPTGRYGIVGALLCAPWTAEFPDLSDQRRGTGPIAVPGPAAAGEPPGELDHGLPAAIRELSARLLDPAGYRSARGVLHDLAICLAELTRGPAIARFTLGTQDVGPAFEVSAVVRGRDRELEQFEAMTRELGGGRSGLLLVSGPSGIGKTALIDALSARRRRGWRIQGKFDQYANSEPYATLTQALRGLVGQILDQPLAVRDEWRARVVAAVAPNAALLFSVIPELRGLIGDQAAVAAIPPVESAARFGETLKCLLVACAAQIGLLVVVLDDMQWCDQASIRLICSLLGDAEVGHILWICAFRDAQHPLYGQLWAAPARGTLHIKLPVGPLARGDLQAFLAATLGCAPARAAALATFFHDKTDGNPLFANTLLSSLHDQGLFTFSAREERWCWDDDAIRSAELPGDIQELIVDKIASLSAPAREILSVASCVGRDVEAGLLVEAMARWEHPRGELAAAIRECVARGLLASSLARPPGDGDAAELLNFTHDRVQQTAYRILDPARREAVLLETGRALLARSSTAEVAEKLFRIVGYLNGGSAQASDELKPRIVELNLIAAQRALVANAFADSARFLQAALALLPEDRWTSRYDQTVELHIKYMHALALLGERAQEDQLFELLCTHVKTPVHVGQIYELKVMLESSRGEHRAAIERAIVGLGALGEHLPATPGKLAALTELARTWRALQKLDPDDLQVRPSSGDEDAAASRLLVALSAPAYLADANLLAIVMMRIVRRSLAFGMSDVSSHGFAGFGLIVSGLLGRYERARQLAMVAHQLDERFGNPWLAPKVDLMSGIFIQPWTRPFEHCEELLARGCRVALGNADFVYASYTATSAACLMYYRGAPLAAVATAAEAALRHTRRARDYDMETVVATVRDAARCLRGETASPAVGDDADRGFLASLDQRTTPIGVFFCRAIRVGVLYLHGRADLACELGREARGFEHNAFSNPSLAEYLFFYAMALLRQAPHATGAARRAANRTIGRALKQFAAWARSCPDNFAARHALLRAEHARVHRRDGVLDQLNAALEAAVRHARVHYEALAAELAAEHCDAVGQATIARIYLERAIAAYRRWGAEHKANQLAARLGAG